MEDAVCTQTMRSRVEQLFYKSDKEGKGFIVRKDMQRMRDDVPLSPDQLEDVFDSLDVGNNGYLTVEQFLCGFGNFLSSSNSVPSTQSSRILESQSNQSIYTNSDSFEDQYQILIEQLKETEILEHVDVLRRLCDDVNLYGSQEIQVNLELFLRQTVRDLVRQKMERKEMAEATRARRDEDEKQVRRLFEEMESHLRDEKQKMATQVDQRIRLVRQQMETEATDKEEALREVTSEKQQVTARLHLSKVKENSLRQDNARLSEEKGELEQQCEEKHREVQRLMLKLEDNESEERRRYMTEGYRLAKRITIETHGLLEQLDLLHSIADSLESYKPGDDHVHVSVKGMPSMHSALG